MLPVSSSLPIISFPRREDYPDNFSILENPEKNPNAYLELVESSASAYFQTDFVTRSLFQKRFYLLEKYLGNLPARAGRNFQRSLDVGCGIGFALPFLAQRSKEVIAVDVSSISIEYARSMAEKRKFSNTQFRAGNILSLPVTNASCDLILCMSVLEHIRDLDAAFRELKRVLAPRGLLIIGYPSETPTFRLLHNTVSALFPKRKKIQEIIAKENPSEETFIGHINNGKKIRTALNKAGFREQETKSICLAPPFLELYRIHFLT